jgi:hypothetical protein
MAHNGSRFAFWMFFLLLAAPLWGANRLHTFVFVPPAPAQLAFGQFVQVQFAYETDEAAGVRIYVDASGGCGVHDGSPLYPKGSGNGSTSFSKAGSDCYRVEVDKVFLRMYSESSGNILHEVEVPVSYTFVNAGGPPDLAVENFAVSSSQVNGGASLTLSATLKNVGEFPITTAYAYGYRSDDQDYDTYNYSSGYHQINQVLTQGGSSAMQIVVEAPSEPGVYYYFIEAFTPSGETNQSNNRSPMIAVTVGAATAAYDYVIPHLPPPANGWQLSSRIFNFDENSLDASYDLYEMKNGSWSKTSLGQEVLSAGVSRSLDDALEAIAGQAWIGITTGGKSLGGDFDFAFRRTATSGMEKACLPLAPITSAHNQLIFAHIPADRTQFFSGFCLVNPNNQPNLVRFHLFGQNGSNLDYLLSSAYVNGATLVAFEKLVSVFEGKVFDDSNSYEKVGWVQVAADLPLAGFELFGKHAELSNGELAGILASPARGAAELHAAPFSLEGVEWTGVTLLNTGSVASTMTMKLYKRDGSLIASRDFTAPAGKKMIGLLSASGFEFPYRDAQPVFSLTSSEVAAIGSLELWSNQPLASFLLCGVGKEEFDGVQIPPLSESLRLQVPTVNGTHKLFLVSAADQAQNVILRRIDQSGQQVESSYLTLAPHACEILPVTGGSLGYLSIETSGGRIMGWIMDRPSDGERTLTFHSAP